MIRNDNPDKGTEMKRTEQVDYKSIRLEMITPIRGRKSTCPKPEPKSTNPIRNDNPDKGTEMALWCVDHYLIMHD